jgi:hypothetical protein
MDLTSGDGSCDDDRPGGTTAALAFLLRFGGTRRGSEPAMRVTVVCALGLAPNWPTRHY